MAQLAPDTTLSTQENSPLISTDFYGFSQILWLKSQKSTLIRGHSRLKLTMLCLSPFRHSRQFLTIVAGVGITKDKSSPFTLRT
jgi:hypothetical protein